jgi:hypothetical protein
VGVPGVEPAPVNVGIIIAVLELSGADRAVPPLVGNHACHKRVDNLRAPHEYWCNKTPDL